MDFGSSRNVRLCKASLCSAFLAWSLCAVTTNAQSASFRGLGILAGGSASYATGVSSDGSTVIGFSCFTSGSQGFRWTRRGGLVNIGPLPGAESNLDVGFVAIQSVDGSVMVGQRNSASGNEAFRWTSQSGVVGLGFLPGATSSVACAVSGDGSVVVGKSCSASGTEAFAWDTVHGLRSLQTVLTADYGLDLTGWNLTAASAISPNGSSIVGYGTNPNGQIEAWLAKVPKRGMQSSSTPGSTKGNSIANTDAGAEADQANNHSIVSAATDSNRTEVYLFIDATKKWQATGVFVKSDTDTISVTRAAGSWTSHSGRRTEKYLDGQGWSGHKAKPGYALPGAPDGALVGRIGDSAPFYIGNRGRVPTQTRGELFLTINDDLDARYGAGYPDNDGALYVVVRAE